MNNRIYIIPTGGLCNRMRAMASGIHLSRQAHCSVSIYWNNTPGLCADFHDLFLPIQDNQINVIVNKKWLYRIEKTRDYILRWLLLNTLYKVVFNHSQIAKGDLQLPPDITSARRWPLLISCYSMCQHASLKELFVPQPKIQSKINEITKDFGENTIGVHIRRTDNIHAIHNSPTDSFYHALTAEISKDPTVKFYLASDDKSVKADFIEKFQGRIITYDKKVERSSLEGMESAVVDLFCLSMTKKIIGSDYSSYSQIAAEINDIELEYVRA